MKGIAGIIGHPRQFDRAVASRQMASAMKHETCLSTGSYESDRLSLSVAWVSLMGLHIDKLPYWNESRDICLLFSGEHHPGLAEISRSQGDSAGRRTYDASGLVQQYDENPSEFFASLNGVFCGLLVDLRRQEIHLFNDRYGLNRVYYYVSPDGFFFSSEAKSLLRVLPELRALDSRGLGELISCGCVLQNRTVFSKLSVLPPAAHWTFRPDGSCHKGSYFSPQAWEELPLLGADEYISQLGATIQRLFPGYLGGKERVGLSMTGGLDSRLIIACADTRTAAPVCYTFGGKYRESTDVRVAKKLANACRLNHQTITVGMDFLTEFPQLAEKTVYLSDGTMDVSGAVELYVNRVARDIAPVRLTGNYGSEILRSFVAFKPGSNYEGVFDSSIQPYLKNAENTYLAESQGRRLSFIAFKQVPWHHHARYSIERSLLTVRSPFLDNELVKLSFQGPEELKGNPAHLLAIIAACNPSLAKYYSDRGYSSLQIPLVSRVFHLFQEFTAKAEYAYDYGMPPWLARIDHVLARAHLERLFLGRHKFYHFRVWYRDSLARYVREILLDPLTLSRPFLNRRRVEKIVLSHTKGTANHTMAIHKLLTYEMIHRTMIDRS